MREIKLKIHEKRCSNCRYYRVSIQSSRHSDCLLLGRILSFLGQPHDDMWRYCDGWKRRPKKWVVECDGNPFYKDAYISRESQKRMRKRLGIVR